MSEHKCAGTIQGTFAECGEAVERAYCSLECRKTAAKRQTTSNDYDFITDRLAIGNVASRATPGFVAVVSLLASAPWDEITEAPAVPNGGEIDELGKVPVLHIDINDGEGPGEPIGDGRDLASWLSSATAFIAKHIEVGCVLVHCGAGKSRSVAVVVAYLCRYVGMLPSEALSFIALRRPGVCPAPCFLEAIKRWLRLDDLAAKGPRG